MFSLLFAVGVGVLAHVLAAERHGGAQLMRLGDGAALDVSASFVFFGLASFVYLMWATVPLSFGGGGEFAPGRLLLYPISLRKLFAIDLLSELTSLASIFAAPALFALAVGAGLAGGIVWRALALALAAAAFGVALAKLMTACVGVLMQGRRARGEALLALLGGVGALSGILVSQGAQFVTRAGTFPEILRWTPPGAFAVALAGGLRTGGAAHFLSALLTLAGYTVVAVALNYRLARRAALGHGGDGGSGGGDGGAKKRQARSEMVVNAISRLSGWRVPFASEALAGVIEKELRYVLRNPQLRVMALMPLVMTFSLRLISSRGGAGQAAAASESSAWWSAAAYYMDGSRAATGVLYAFLITSALSCNMFAYDAGGMRAFVLAPIARRTILIGKNVAVLAVSLVCAVAVTLLNWAVYRELTWRGLLFTSLCFVLFASGFACIGNWFSLRFPKRLQFGKRMNASGMAGLLLLPICLALALPPAIAVLVGYLTRSLFVEYATLALFACAGMAAYWLALERQGRVLARRELDILDAVTGRGDE